MNTSDPNSSDTIVDQIYEAAVIPELWPEVLRCFKVIADSRAAALLATKADGFKWVGCSAEAEEIALKHYTFAGGHERTRRLLAVRRAGFVSDLDVFTEQEILAEPLYRDYLIPNGYGRGIATVINVPTGDTLFFNAEGNYRAGPLPAFRLERLEALRPHLARSAMLSARLAFERARSAVETLSGLGLAACAVSLFGKVVSANSEFVLESAPWTTRANDRIAVLDKRADRLVNDAIMAIHTDGGVRSVPIAATEGRPPAVLHVIPIRRTAHDLFDNAVAILVLTSASSRATEATPLLQALFDLTPVEASVAASIAAGETAADIARANGKSVETVRHQLKSVLEKCGCRRQVDLARLLAQLILRQDTSSPR